MLHVSSSILDLWQPILRVFSRMLGPLYGFNYEPNIHVFVFIINICGFLQHLKRFSTFWEKMFIQGGISKWRTPIFHPISLCGFRSILPSFTHKGRNKEKILWWPCENFDLTKFEIKIIKTRQMSFFYCFARCNNLIFITCLPVSELLGSNVKWQKIAPT